MTSIGAAPLPAECGPAPALPVTGGGPVQPVVAAAPVAQPAAVLPTAPPVAAPIADATAGAATVGTIAPTVPTVPAAPAPISSAPPLVPNVPTSAPAASADMPLVPYVPGAPSSGPAPTTTATVATPAAPPAPSPVMGGGAPGTPPGAVTQGPTQAPVTGCACCSGGHVPTQAGTGRRRRNQVAQQGNTGGDVTQAPVGKKIVKIARKELKKGVTEDAGDNTDSRGRIQKYRRAVTGAGENPKAAEPWCADFASYVWKKAGVPFGRNGEGDDYTVSMMDYAKQSGSWKDSNPKPGDLVMISWSGGSSPDHVAVVEKVKNGKVTTIAGNEGDRIKRSTYSMGDSQMVGFITPQA